VWPHIISIDVTKIAFLKLRPLLHQNFITENPGLAALPVMPLGAMGDILSPYLNKTDFFLYINFFYFNRRLGTRLHRRAQGLYMLVVLTVFRNKKINLFGEEYPT